MLVESSSSIHSKLIWYHIMQLNVAVQFVQQLQQLIIGQEMTVGVWRSFYFLSFYFFIYFMHVSITSPYGNVQLSMRPPAWGPRPQWEAWPHGLLCPRTKPTAPKVGFAPWGLRPRTEPTEPKVGLRLPRRRKRVGSVRRRRRGSNGEWRRLGGEEKSEEGGMVREKFLLWSSIMLRF